MPEERAGFPILAFAAPADWEAWLAAAPRGTLGLWLKLARKGSGTASVTQAEAVEGALCHGWIDGQAAPYDGRHWLIRFTPRRPRSKWSLVNREQAEALIAAGCMADAGLTEVAAARADGRWDAATRRRAGRRYRRIWPRRSTPRPRRGGTSMRSTARTATQSSTGCRMRRGRRRARGASPAS